MTHQPLRIPSGWHVTYNAFWEEEPSAEQIADGFYGQSSVFLAVHEQGRYILEAEWRPFNDPNGRFVVVLRYSPFGRTDRGRRLETPVEFQNSQIVHEGEAVSRSGLVVELEALLTYGAEVRREAS